jgi:hypothetical protein
MKREWTELGSSKI